MTYSLKQSYSDLASVVRTLIDDYNPLHSWPLHREEKMLLESIIRFYDSPQEAHHILVVRISRPSGNIGRYSNYYSPLELGLEDDTVKELYDVLETARNRGVRGNYGKFEGELTILKDWKLKTHTTGKLSGKFVIGDNTYSVEFFADPMRGKPPTLTSIQKN